MWMELLADAPDFVSVALLMAVALTAATIVALVYLLLLRFQFVWERSITRQIKETWEPVFKLLQVPAPFSVPDTSNREMPYLLSYWLEKREFATNQFAVSLDELAEQLQLHLTVNRLLSFQPLTPFAAPARLVAIAIRAARWIDTEQTRRALYSIAEGTNYSFALQATETLLYLGDRDSTRLVVQLLFRYPEHDKYTTTRLGHAGGARVIRVLDPFLEKLSRSRLEDFVYLIEQSGDKSLLPILVRRLGGPRSAEEVASLLRAISKIGEPAQRSLVLPYLNSDSTFIRLQAAAALARVGQAEDAELLLPLLSDPEWWVRYRAAQTYLSLHDGDPAEIEQLIASHADRFARDILVHANSERAWHRT